MEPLPGYRLASWERGYGDLRVVPDWGTARRLPWLEGTALLLGDLHHPDGRPVEEAPRRILRRQIARAAGHRLTPVMASELECYLFQTSYADTAAGGFRTLRPTSAYLEDYHLLQGTREEPLLRRLRNEMEGAGVPMEGTKGEWGRGQTELNLAYSGALEAADRHVLLKHGAKEIAGQAGDGRDLHGQAGRRRGRLQLPHPRQPVGRAGEQNRFAATPALFEQFLAGQLALARELTLFYAPTINSYKRYQSLSWAPTAVTWGQDNRTCGFRTVGHGRGRRVENRLPGADANPYLAYAAIIAAGLYGIERALPLEPPFRGNAYLATGVPRIPNTLRGRSLPWRAAPPPGRRSPPAWSSTTCSPPATRPTLSSGR